MGKKNKMRKFYLKVDHSKKGEVVEVYKDYEIEKIDDAFNCRALSMWGYKSIGDAKRGITRKISVITGKALGYKVTDKKCNFRYPEKSITKGKEKVVLMCGLRKGTKCFSGC